MLHKLVSITLTFILFLLLISVCSCSTAKQIPLIIDSVPFTCDNMEVSACGINAYNCSHPNAPFDFNSYCNGRVVKPLLNK
jgi:hypothetical protein